MLHARLLNNFISKLYKQADYVHSPEAKILTSFTFRPNVSYTHLVSGHIISTIVIHKNHFCVSNRKWEIIAGRS